MATSQYCVDYGAGNDTTGDGTVGAPWKTIQKALDTITRNATDGDQINIKAGTAQVLAASLTLATYGTPTAAGPLILRGYTSAINDGGMGEIDCGGFTMWASTAYDYIYHTDLDIHTFGDNTGVYLSNNLLFLRCRVHKGASSPSGKYAIRSDFGSLSVLGCYLYDMGTNGSGIYCAQAALFAKGNLIVTSGSGRGIYAANGIGDEIAGNVIARDNATGEAINLTGWGNVHHNICYNSAAGTSSAIAVSGAATCMNNIVVGQSGTGGKAISGNNIIVLGYNAFYNCSTPVSFTDQIFNDLTANDVTLAANPFTDAANGDFGLTIAGKAALRAVGWPAAYLGAHANTDGHVTIGPIQYGEAEAAADYPAESDVRLGVDYNSGGSTGTLDLPAVTDVQSGVTFDGATKTGTFAAPAVGDVQDGVTYGAAAEYTGTLVLPTEAQVESGIGFGAGGTEFTGSLVSGSDWTTDEKEQIRQALGITGDTAATSGTGTLEAAFAALAEDTEIADAVLVAMNAAPPAVNVTLWKDQTAPDAPPSKAELDALETHGDATWATADVSALATAAALATVDGIVDAIKLKTDLISADGSVSVTAAISGSTITILRGDSLSVAIAGLGDISTRSKLWFTAKQDTGDADTSAIIQLEETDGLVRLNGAAGTAVLGEITVTDEDAGDITITLDETATDDLTPRRNMSYDVQVLTATGTVTTLTSGTLHVTADVTRAVA